MQPRCLRPYVALLAMSSLNASGQSASFGASTPVANVTFSDLRAVEIVKTLAERYRVVIGMSGVLLMGSDDRLVSVSVQEGTFKDVLDAFVRADPRFTWRQEDDGAIAVVTKSASLPVLDVVVKSFDVDHPDRYSLTRRIINLPEVKEWLHKNACQMIEIIDGVGHPAGPDTWPIELHLKDVRLRAVFNRLALESKTYFWTAAQIDQNPCTINIRP